MPAETAAPAAGVTAATESNDNASPENQQVDQDQQQQASPSIGERAHAILTEMEIPEDVQESLKPKGTTNAEAKEKSETPGHSESPERVDAGQPENAGGKDNAEAARQADEEEALTPEQQKSWPPEALQRIHKATAKRRDAETRAETAERIAVEQNAVARQLHQQLQSAGQRKAAPTPEDPLADVVTVQDLQTAIDLNEELLEWATTNPDGLEDVVIGKDPETGEPIKRSYTAKDMAAIVAKTGRILRREVPRKAGWLQEQQQHEQFARVALPEMFQEGTDEHAAYQQLQQNVPELFSRLPGAQQWVAWALRGRAAWIAELQEKQKAETAGGSAAAAANGKAKVKPEVAAFLRPHQPLAPGMPGAGGGLKAEKPSKDSARKEAVDKFTEEGAGDDALENLLVRTRRMQAQPEENAVLV